MKVWSISSYLFLLVGKNTIEGFSIDSKYNNNVGKHYQGSSGGSTFKSINPSTLSQKHVIANEPNYMSITRRETIKMPTQTPMVPYKAPGSQYTQMVDLNSAMYRDRKIMVSKFIDENAANEIISIILYMRKENTRQPITLFFNVPGALLRPSLAIYDLLQQTKADGAKIITVNLGMCTGMGAFLCAAGSKGMRSAMPNSRFLLQRTGLDEVIRGQATDIVLEVKSIKSMNDRMEKELSTLSGQSVEQIQNDLKRDFYLSADEAVLYGLIDKVNLPAPLKRSSQPITDLGAFESGDDQKYQDRKNQDGGWGSTQQVQQQPPKKDDDDDGPQIAKG